LPRGYQLIRHGACTAKAQYIRLQDLARARSRFGGSVALFRLQVSELDKLGDHRVRCVRLLEPNRTATATR
jgi:hypothetical protein